MPVPKGTRVGGRTKGTPNRQTKILKDAILEAATRAGREYGKDGMISYLEHQALNNPNLFMPLLGKVIPLQVTGEDGAPITIVTRKIVRAGD